MDIKEILSKVDHTLLRTDSTWSEVAAVLDDSVKYGTASACISPCYVAQAKEYLAGRGRICTVIGFPSGCPTAASKCFEAEDAIKNGADEIDTVINVGHLKDGRTDDILSELKQLRAVTSGHILKVIIETCLLTDEEKTVMCRLVTESGADFIKTSTGFSTAGANAHDVELLAKNVGPKVRVKAAGGIKTLDDAKLFIELGASRLGTSRIVKIVKERGLVNGDDI